MVFHEMHVRMVLRDKYEVSFLQYVVIMKRNVRNAANKVTFGFTGALKVSPVHYSQYWSLPSASSTAHAFHKYDK